MYANMYKPTCIIIEFLINEFVASVDKRVNFKVCQNSRHNLHDKWIHSWRIQTRSNFLKTEKKEHRGKYYGRHYRGITRSFILWLESWFLKLTNLYSKICVCLLYASYNPPPPLKKEKKEEKRQLSSSNKHCHEREQHRVSFVIQTVIHHNIEC